MNQTMTSSVASVPYCGIFHTEFWERVVFWRNAANKQTNIDENITSLSGITHGARGASAPGPQSYGQYNKITLKIPKKHDIYDENFQSTSVDFASSRLVKWR